VTFLKAKMLIKKWQIKPAVNSMHDQKDHHEICHMLYWTLFDKLND